MNHLCPANALSISSARGTLLLLDPIVKADGSVGLPDIPDSHVDARYSEPEPESVCFLPQTFVANGEESAPLHLRATKVFRTNLERRFNSHSLAVPAIPANPRNLLNRVKTYLANQS